MVLGAGLAGALTACTGEETCNLPNTICTVGGTGQNGYSGDDGPATAAALSLPVDTAVAPDGELWVIDFNNFMIRAIDARGTIRRVVGTGTLGGDAADGPAIDADLNHVGNLVFHGGYAYVAAWHNSRVKRVRLDDGVIENFAGRGTRTAYDGDGGPAVDAGIDLPASLAIDPDGNVVIMDQGNQVLRRVDASGTIATIAGKCVVDESCSEPSATCPGSHKLTCEPAMCGSVCLPGFAGDGAAALEARLAQPYGSGAPPGGRMAYDAAGDLVFADSGNHRIRRIDRAGVITTITGTGTGGYSGDDGPAALAQVNRPTDVAIAADGTIYFTDVDNHCIRKIDPAGQISRVVGQCVADHAGGGFLGDGGPPLDARLRFPFGLDLVGTRLYVSDTGNHRVRVVHLPD